MRWPDLSRLGIELRVFTGPPPLLVVRGSAADLAEHGFEQRGEAWVRSVTRFEATDLKRWFPGFAPGDIREMAREQVVVSDVLSDVASELDSPRTGADHTEKNAQLDADFRLRSVEIIEALISRGDIAALYAAAGVRGPDAFDDLAMDDRAAAYIVFAGRNGVPDLTLEDYNTKVARLEREANIRRLQSDQTVRQANGGPFKNADAAARFSDEWDLGDTHAVREVEGAYVLVRLGEANRPSAIKAMEERQAADPAHQPVTVEDQGADRGAVNVAAEIARHIGGTDPREQAAKIKGLLHTNTAGLREVERSLKTAPEERIIPLQTQAVQHEQNIAKLSQWLEHVEPNPEASHPNQSQPAADIQPSQQSASGAASKVGVGETAKEPWQMSRSEFDSWPRPFQHGMAGQFGIKRDVRQRDKQQESNRNKLSTTPGGRGGDAAPTEFFADGRDLHREIIEKAMSDGKPVPAEVLADYPELRAAQNPEASRLNPEAESQAPAPSKPGEGGVAPTEDEAAPGSDKNIGREWDSTYGRQKIVNVIPGKAEFGIQPMYEVQTAETGDIRRYSADKIEETIRGDEHRLTPEYEKEQAEKAEINRLRIERDARAKAKREAEDAEIAAFAASKRMAPPNAEKARAALTAQISANGTPISRKNLVEKLIAEGRTVGQFNGKRTLETSDGTFFDERQITKTGIDYAEYLIAKKSETKPAAPVAERVPAETVVKEFRRDDGAAKWVDQNVSQDQLPNTGVGEIKLSGAKETGKVVAGRMTNTKAPAEIKTVFRANDGRLVYVQSDANANTSAVVSIEAGDDRLTMAAPEESTESAPTDAIAKQEKPKNTRFVVKDDGVETKVEWQHEARDGWERLTAFDSLDNAVAASKSQGYGDIPVFESEWSPSAKRFLPAKPAQGTPADTVQAPEKPGASTAAAYTAPTSLEDARRRWSAANVRDPAPERGTGHVALMDAIRKALAAKLFYNRDVENFVAKDLGVTAEQRKVGTSEDPNAIGALDLVEGGAFGYDVYLARQKVESENAKQAEIAAAGRMKLSVGMNVGKLKLNDGKLASAATVESLTPTGVVLVAQRGPQKIRITTGYVALEYKADRAENDFFKRRAPSETAIAPADEVDGGLFAQPAQDNETPASLSTGDGLLEGRRDSEQFDDDTASDEVSSDQRGAQAQGAPALAAIAEHQPTRLGQRVVKILDAAAIRDRLQAEPDFELAIANPPFADLCVEALAGEGFTLTRYGQVENGDERVVDAEVVFHIDADGHLIVHETCSYSAEHGEVRGRDAKFADAMVKALIEQGFAETEATRKEKARIEDAGEKIGGARKDQYHRITLDVLREMNDREKILYLKKDAIWPPISIDAAREAGVPVELLVMGREVRALVAPGIKDPAVAETYVRVVSGLQDAYAASTSPGEFISAIERMAIEVGVIEEREQKAYWGSDRMVKVRGTTSIYTDLQKAGWDYRKLNKIFWDPHVLSKKGRVFKEWCEQFPDADGYALLASRYARSGARVVEENDKIPSRPHLASIRRLGLPDERAGDIAAEDLIARFGFRGVEFGNWLPQDERQDVLNKAYDAFSTLAFVLGFPDKMMSLDGTLALAFGSRGKSRAAAHYEPGRTVINLTRMNGAGSTAHEFFHALDDWVAGVVRKHFAEKGDVGIPTDAMFGTEFAIQRTKSRRRRPAITRATTRELRWHKDLFADVAPWFHMAASFLERTRTLDEIKHRLERKTAIWRDALERWACFGIRASGVSKEDAEKHATEAVQELDTRALARLCDRLFGEDPDNHEKMLECVTGLREVQQAQAQIERHPESAQLSLATTDYFENAKLLDSKTPSKPYYSLARELGARAFECYVFDKLAAMEARDDYLVHGVEETRFSEGYRGNPYPCGADRLEINRRMEEALKKVAEKFVPSYTYETTRDLFAPVPRMAACR